LASPIVLTCCGVARSRMGPQPGVHVRSVHREPLAHAADRASQPAESAVSAAHQQVRLEAFDWYPNVEPASILELLSRATNVPRRHFARSSSVTELSRVRANIDRFRGWAERPAGQSSCRRSDSKQIVIAGFGAAGPKRTDHVIVPLSPLDPRRLAPGFTDVLLRFVVHPTRGLRQIGHDRMGLVDYIALALRLGVRGGIGLAGCFASAVAELFRLRRSSLSAAAEPLRAEHERRLSLLAELCASGSTVCALWFSCKHLP